MAERAALTPGKVRGLSATSTSEGVFAILAIAILLQGGSCDGDGLAIDFNGSNGLLRFGVGGHDGLGEVGTSGLRIAEQFNGL